MRIEKIDISRVEPNPWNPNRLTSKQFKSLVKEIKKRGFLQPILVRKLRDKYQIIDGEHRWKAGKEAGLKEIPAVIVDVDDKVAKILTLNMNHLRGEDDVIELSKIIKDLTNYMDLEHLAEETYITVAELNALLDVDVDFDVSELPEKEEKKKTVTCPQCGYEFEI